MTVHQYWLSLSQNGNVASYVAMNDPVGQSSFHVVSLEYIVGSLGVQVIVSLFHPVQSALPMHW